MNGQPNMFGQQNVPAGIQQQLLMQQLQQQQLLQQQQQQQLLQQQQQQQQLQAAAYANPTVPGAGPQAAPGYGTAVAQMQAMLASQRAAQQAAAAAGQQQRQQGMHAGPTPLQLPQQQAYMSAQGLSILQPAGLPAHMQQPAAPPAAGGAMHAPAVAAAAAAAGLAGAVAAPAGPAAAAAVPPKPPMAAAPGGALAAAPQAAAPAAAQHQPPVPQPAAAGAAADAAAADPRFEKVGFAKLLGDGLEFYIKKYEIVLGRKSKAVVDVVLGDTPVLSRQHCRILYNFQAKKWQLVVEGKNGVVVNGVLHTPGSGPCYLTSQDLLQAGDMNFYFLLPKQPRKAPSKPKSKLQAAAPAAAAAAAAGAGGSTSGLSLQDQQQQQQQQQPGQATSKSVPGTPVLGGGSAASGQVLGSSPVLPGSSPALPQAGVVLPGLAAAAGGGPAAVAAAAPGGASGLQHYHSGPLLSDVGLSPGGVYQGVGLQGSGLSVQGFVGNGGVGGSQDLLQQGLGDGLDDEGMMDV